MENIKVFLRVHNTQAKEKEIVDRWRGMPTAQMGRHLANQVEPEVVEALEEFCCKSISKNQSSVLRIETEMAWSRSHAGLG